MARIFDADQEASFGTLKFKGKDYPMSTPSVRQMEKYRESQDEDKGFEPMYKLLETMGVPCDVAPELPLSIIKGIAEQLAEDVGSKKSETGS